MSELRKDPIVHRWVIIDANRMKRPSDFITDTQNIKINFCPFCEGNEDKTPPEIYSIRDENTHANQAGWDVRVIPNKYPVLQIHGDLNPMGNGLYDKLNGIGAHEVIIESPDHLTTTSDLDHELLQKVLRTYKYRMSDLKRDKRLKYTIIFKNVGAASGATIEHLHSQLVGISIVPKRVKEELVGSEEYYKMHGRCIFCDMIQNEIKESKRVVFETENFIAIEPYASRFPFETWILPKSHQSHFEKISENEIQDLSGLMKTFLFKLENILDKPPYNYMIHTAPFNIDNSPYYHWHFEIIPRLTKVAGFEWGTGFYINFMAPELATQYLREV